MNIQRALTLVRHIAHLESIAAEAKVAEQRRTQEMEEWSAIAASTELGPIRAFLVTWPEGHFATQARARIKELTQESLATIAPSRLLLVAIILMLVAAIPTACLMSMYFPHY